MVLASACWRSGINLVGASAEAKLLDWLNVGLRESHGQFVAIVRLDVDNVPQCLVNRDLAERVAFNPRSVSLAARARACATPFAMSHYSAYLEMHARRVPDLHWRGMPDR